MSAKRKTKIGKVKINPRLEKLLDEYKKVRGRQYRLDGLFRELVANKTGMTMTEQSCLGYLLEKGQAAPTELAKITGLTTGAITGVVTRLEKRGCLTTTRDTKDRRKVIIRPVVKEAALPMVYYRPMTEKYYRLLSTFNEDQIKFLTYKSQCITKFLVEEIDRLSEEEPERNKKKRS
ncbi:MAG: hypothetical protein RL141_790 [Candidatus Parcubacteria bacterium]|jgi:DNA-binding MarR family transcriptional regulator